MNHFPNRRTGFTLIEVLVVISIIGVLVAMLLPALNEARTTAQESQCLSNTRSQFTGQVLYATDSRDLFAEHSNPFPLYYKSLSNNPAKTGPYQRLKPDYLADGKIFDCPRMDALGGIEADPTFYEFACVVKSSAGIL